MKKYVAYLRVSTRSQKLDGLGMESQDRVVADFVNRQGGELLEKFREIESGSKTDSERPALSSALSLAGKVGATLIVAKLDRLSRIAGLLMSLHSAGVDFVCCDCPNVDRFTVGILALVAQRERELISERTKLALQSAKLRGRKLGTRNPAEQVLRMNLGARRACRKFAIELIPIIREIRSTGVDTLQGISDCLNRRGYRSRTGGKFHPSTVQRVLRSAA